MKRKILTGITCAEIIVMLIGASALDSPNLTVPVILVAQALAWIAIFVISNNRGGRYGKRRKSNRY